MCALASKISIALAGRKRVHTGSGSSASGGAREHLAQLTVVGGIWVHSHGAL
jgi:hypothetical protein